MEASKENQEQNREHKTLMLDEKTENWSEHVENLRDGGDTTAAISFLELFISRRDDGSSASTRDLQLAAAMSDLADLYSSIGDTIKSDELRSRALSIRVRKNEESCTPVDSAKSRVAGPSTTTVPSKEKDTEESMLSTTSNNDVEDGENDWESLADGAENDPNLLSLKPKAEALLAESSTLNTDVIVDDWESLADGAENDPNLLSLKPRAEAILAESSTLNADVADDWEVVADRQKSEPNLLSLKQKTETSLTESGNLGQKGKDKNTSASEQKPKRRGRGSFLYEKNILYSDAQGEFIETSGLRQDTSSNTERENEANLAKRHVLVLYELSTSTRTTELEKIFQAFDDAEVAIRWVNDTSALAVFSSPSLADRAKNCIPRQYKVRALHDDDELLSQVKTGDLEPPRPRPQTSTRTAERMIAQATRLHISSPGSGIHEHKQQERERKNRLIARQNLRDDAWGSD